jgi:intein-encoded DNA endonuclease-like protein
VIHPSVPADVREKLVKELRRRHVNVDKIHRVVRDDRVGVSWSDPIRGYRYHHHVRRHSLTLSNLRSIAQRLDRRAIQIRKKIEKLEKKQKQKKRKG